MKKLTSYLSEAKNTNMTHIEDLILDGGVKGARQAILALRSLRDMLSGNARAPVDITVKWDGAPAVFAGLDPSDGQFFVAKKGIFAKNPKVYKNHDDIDADTSGDLNKKLKLAFDNLKNLGIKTDKTSFHSLRHNLTDSFREAGVSDELAENFMGRSTGSTGEAYGTGFSLKKHHKEINKIEFQHILPFRPSCR